MKCLSHVLINWNSVENFAVSLNRLCYISNYTLQIWINWRYSTSHWLHNLRRLRKCMKRRHYYDSCYCFDICRQGSTGNLYVHCITICIIEMKKLPKIKNRVGAAMPRLMLWNWHWIRWVYQRVLMGGSNRYFAIRGKGIIRCRKRKENLALYQY